MIDLSEYDYVGEKLTMEDINYLEQEAGILITHTLEYDKECGWMEWHFENFAWVRELIELDGETELYLQLTYL